MGLYDALKDAVSLAQKADNIELYRQLLDLSSQALDLQAENHRLKEQIAELQKRKDMEGQLIRHPRPYLTLTDDNIPVKYCAICWDNDRKLIQMHEIMEITNSYSWVELRCHKCNNRCQPDS